MKQPERVQHAIAAPAHLGLESRAGLRRAAVDALDALPADGGVLIVDLSLTRVVDSAGLGTLVLIQQHAVGRGQIVRLRGASDELRLLLELTKLEELFEIERVREP